MNRPKFKQVMALLFDRKIVVGDQEAYAIEIDAPPTYPACQRTLDEFD